MPLEGTQLGHYRLVRLIGNGSMGEIYLAEDRRITRQVAIKIVRAETNPYPDEQATREATRLFQREMRAITALDHPHILPLYDFGEQQVNKTVLTYMVMPYRPDGSLSDWLQQRSTGELLSLQDISHLLEQAADALQHAHDHQLLHQDVKPSNFLMRSRAGHPNQPDLLLADFGIAKFTNAMATASQSIRGTPAYMAPEQWDGQPVPATDQYALAIMAYQMLTGRPPFVGGPGQVMRQHFTAQPQPPSTLNPRIPPPLDAVLLRALAKTPQERFPGISDFARAFQQALKSTGDMRATLAISRTEALTGGKRTLNLPGNRQLVVTIPAGTQDGQILRLEGQGESYYEGGPGGALLLTISISPTEEIARLPWIQGSASSFVEKTAYVTPPPTVSPLHSPPTPLPPVYTSPPTQSAYPPPQQQPIHSLEPSTPPRRRMSTTRKWILVGVILALVLASIGLLSNSIINQPKNTTNGTANNTSALISGNLTSTAQVNSYATIVAQSNSTATASAATMTAQNPDPYNTGTLAFFDPLQDNSRGNLWPDDGSLCTFSGGAYNVSVTGQGNNLCESSAAPDLTNLTAEVQMKIVQGDCGGFDIRNDSVGNYYIFQVCQDGSYTFALSTQQSSPLASGKSSAVKTGLNQANLLAVVANGSSFSLYINHQHVKDVSDSTNTHGGVGLLADDIHSASTTVIFTNLKIWTF